jgi:hypothetical protein
MISPPESGAHQLRWRDDGLAPSRDNWPLYHKIYANSREKGVDVFIDARAPCGKDLTMRAGRWRRPMPTELSPGRGAISVACISEAVTVRRCRDGGRYCDISNSSNDGLAPARTRNGQADAPGASHHGVVVAHLSRDVSCLSCSMTSARDQPCLSSTASPSIHNAGSRLTCCVSSSDAPSNPPPTQRSMPDSIATSIPTAMYAAKKAASMITKTATTSPANHKWCHLDGNTRGSDRHTADGGPRPPRRTANIEYPQARCHSSASVCPSSPLSGARLKTMSSGITRSVAIISSL